MRRGHRVRRYDVVFMPKKQARIANLSTQPEDVVLNYTPIQLEAVALNYTQKYSLGAHPVISFAWDMTRNDRKVRNRAHVEIGASAGQISMRIPMMPDRGSDDYRRRRRRHCHEVGRVPRPE
jgi:hypothetical protein